MVALVLGWQLVTGKGRKVGMTVTLVVLMGAVAGGFVQGLSGFAFGMVAMSFWIWVLEPQVAAVLIIYGSWLGQMIAALLAHRRCGLAQLLPFLLGGLPGILLGILLLPHLDMLWFKALFGGFLLCWSVAMLGLRPLPWLGRGGGAADGIIGLLAGMLGGIAGLTGPLPTLWCTLRGLPKDQHRAIVQNFNGSMLLVILLCYLGKGSITLSMLPLLGWVSLAVLLPTLLGIRLYRGLSEQGFRRLLLLMLSLSGGTMLSAAIPALLARG